MIAHLNKAHLEEGRNEIWLKEYLVKKKKKATIFHFSERGLFSLYAFAQRPCFCLCLAKITNSV